MLLSIDDPVLSYSGLNSLFINIIKEDDYNENSPYLNILKTPMEILAQFPKVEIQVGSLDPLADDSLLIY